MTYIAELDPNSPIVRRAEMLAESEEWTEDDLDIEDRRFVSELDTTPED